MFGALETKLYLLVSVTRTQGDLTLESEYLTTVSVDGKIKIAAQGVQNSGTIAFEEQPNVSVENNF